MFRAKDNGIETQGRGDLNSRPFLRRFGNGFCWLDVGGWFGVGGKRGHHVVQLFAGLLALALRLGTLAFHLGTALLFALSLALLGRSLALVHVLHGIVHSLGTAVARALFAEFLVGSTEFILLGRSGQALGLVVGSRKPWLLGFGVDYLELRTLVVSRVVGFVHSGGTGALLTLLVLEDGRAVLAVALLAAVALGGILLNLVDFGECERLFGLHGRALFLGAEDAVVGFRLFAHTHQGLLRCLLLAVLLRPARAAAHRDAFEYNDRAEALAALFGFGVDKLDVDAVLLAPFKQLALEVHLLLRYIVEVDVAADDAVLDKPVAVLVAAVEVDGAHQCLESVAADVGVAHARALGGDDELFESHLRRQAVESLALHNLRTGGSEETLALVFEVAEEDVAHHRLEHGIAEVFKSFVVERLCGRVVALRLAVAAVAAARLAVAAVAYGLFAPAVAKRLVRESHAVDVYVVRIKSEYVVKYRKELPVLAEGEFHAVQ